LLNNASDLASQFAISKTINSQKQCYNRQQQEKAVFAVDLPIVFAKNYEENEI